MTSSVETGHEALNRVYIAPRPHFDGFRIKIGETAFLDRLADTLHQLLIIGKIVPGE